MNTALMMKIIARHESPASNLAAKSVAAHIL